MSVLLYQIYLYFQPAKIAFYGLYSTLEEEYFFVDEIRRRI